jgi:hypothetical protein
MKPLYDRCYEVCNFMRISFISCQTSEPGVLLNDNNPSRLFFLCSRAFVILTNNAERLIIEKIT